MSEFEVRRSCETLASELTDRKLQRSDTINVDAIGAQLDALERGAGKTYFEFVLEIIGDHRNIMLVAA
jgi:hypothetical protein